MKPAVLIVGGYGVFGGRLARLLLSDGRAKVFVAGRSESAARRFCARYGGEPLFFDRDARDLASALRRLEIFTVIDAAGPFQAYGLDPYRLPRAALEAGCHYLDLCDSADFVAGIGSFDAAARSANRVVLSGASSVPALAASVVAELKHGLRLAEMIETIILPGNRAPRGLSVVRAIVSRAGLPLSIWRGGSWTVEPSWGELRRERISVSGVPPLSARWSSPVSTPDLKLFPTRFGARSVHFRAGLELSLLHLGLYLLAWLPRLGLVRSLLPLARLLHWVAARFEGLGTDRGGMQVSVTGRDGEGRWLTRRWSLIVEAGDGPTIPAIPAVCLVRRLLNRAVAAGARPCLDEVPLAEFEETLRGLSVCTGVAEIPAPPLYQQVLGAQWSVLPEALRRVHTIQDREEFAGLSSVETGGGLLGSLMRWLLGFPPAHAELPVRVTMERRGKVEHWLRCFGRWHFKSTLFAPIHIEREHICEQFGPIRFLLRLPSSAAGLEMPIVRAWVFGLPIPRWLSPTSKTYERVDRFGRFAFDVDISLPVVGRLIRYRGWLKPVVDSD